jgi:lipoate-protein ligase A
MPSGESPTPDKTRIRVKLAVIAGRLADVRVGGDFAVLPADETAAVLAAIAEGLTGASADLDVAALAARIRAAVPFGVALVGTSPERIAVAVRQALESEGGSDRDSASVRPDSTTFFPPTDTITPTFASPPSPRIGSFTTAEIDALTAGWAALAWRVIPEQPLSAAVNVALDEVIADRVANGTSPPTLRFWRWTETAVVIGRCQSVANEVDESAAAERGVHVVRRITGGGAMFVQPHGAITYSLCLPESAVAGLTIRQSYEVCDAWVIRALRKLGVDAHHVPVNDIACAAGKIGGAAQSRRRGVVLHHTTLAYDLDNAEMAQVLRIGRAKRRDKAVPSARKLVSPLTAQTALPRAAIVAQLLAAFRQRYGGVIVELTAEELAAAQRLVAEKYATAAWTQEFA